MTILTKRNIAVVVAGIDQSYQNSILNGIESAAAEFEFDISVFASFSGTMGNLGHDKGELNIFKLPDFSEFDGAILMTNTIDYHDVAENIINRVIESGIPAVSIDNDVPELLYIGIDNRSAMRLMTEHFIKVHNFTKFNYISGPKDNPESADRLNAFLQVLEEKGIPIEKERIYYGDFRAPSGRAAIKYFLNSGLEMPQAIICANDVMAASAIDTLSESGMLIPDDIAVSGFDNTYNHYNFHMELTSVERPLKLSGQLAGKMLYNSFNNIGQERRINLYMDTFFTDSCGCHDKNSDEHDIGEFRELNYVNYRKYEETIDYMALFNKLSCELLGSDTFEEYVDSLKKFILKINPEEFYFCLCSNWASDMLTDGRYKKNDSVPHDYTYEMLVPIAYHYGEFLDINCLETKKLLSGITKKDSAGKFRYFMPLHFSDRCLGFMVINHSKLPLHNSMFQSWCITISNSLENIRKLICLDYAVHRLEKLYAQDTFSGIYNRNGFVRATSEVYDRCIEDGKEVMLMFIDLDGLKNINDTYGHAIGDIAICNIADILRKSCAEGEVYCRFGGDEFIIFASDFTHDDAYELKKRIARNIEEVNATHKNPFKLSASAGFVIAKPHKGEDLFHFVTQADKIMYEEKRRKKVSSYLGDTKKGTENEKK